MHGFPQIVAAEEYVLTHHLGDVISQSFSATEQTFPNAAAVQAPGEEVRVRQPDFLQDSQAVHLTGQFAFQLVLLLAQPFQLGLVFSAGAASRPAQEGVHQALPGLAHLAQ